MKGVSIAYKASNRQHKKREPQRLLCDTQNDDFTNFDVTNRLPLSVRDVYDTTATR